MINECLKNKQTYFYIKTYHQWHSCELYRGLERSVVIANVSRLAQLTTAEAIIAPPAKPMTRLAHRIHRHVLLPFRCLLVEYLFNSDFNRQLRMKRSTNELHCQAGCARQSSGGGGRGLDRESVSRSIQCS